MRPVRILTFGLCCAAAFAAACAAPAAAPTPRPEPLAATPVLRDVLDAPWTVARRVGSFANTIRLSSLVVSRVDTAERTDSSTSIVRVSWTRLAGDEPARISGLVTEYGVGVGVLGPTPLAGLRLPVPFSATDGWGAKPAQLDVAPSGACSLAAAVLQPARDLFITTPPSLQAGTSWDDSSSYTICRDSIPLQVRSVRSFRVVGAERRAEVLVVIVDRTSNVTMVGEGSQFGEEVAIEAAGSGTMRLELRLDDGSVFAGLGEVSLKMTMRGRRRSQDLEQRARIEISSP